MTATRISVDSITYRVMVEYDSMKRSFELMEGDNQGTAVSGRTIRDILGTNYTYSMTVRADPDYPSDYDAFYWKISEPVDYHSIQIPCGGVSYDASLWEKGSLNTSSGTNASNTSTTRIRTSTYLNSSIKEIEPIQGYQFNLAVYNSSNVYQGMWTGTALSTSTATWLNKKIVLSDVGSYKFRLVVRNSVNGTLASNAAENILFNTGSISFEAKILSGNDVYKGYFMQRKNWDELEVTFEPMEPQRK